MPAISFFLQRLKIAIVIFYAQSNEAGPGCKWATASNASDTVATSVRNPNLFGFPNILNVGQSSMFDQFLELVSRRGIQVRLFNKAVGHTGIVGSWAGKPYPWVANYTFAVNQWVYPGGALKFKVTTSGAAGATQPVWTNYTAGQTGIVDGACRYTAYAADANDVIGQVYRPGQSGYDPNGRIAAGLALITNLKANGWTVWNFTAGHQDDVANNETAANVTTALSDIVAQSLTAGSDKVILGVTPRYVGNANESQWNAPNGLIYLPRQNVLTAYANDPRVIAGYDTNVAAMNDPALGEDSMLHRNHAGEQIGAKIIEAWAVSAGLLPAA